MKSFMKDGKHKRVDWGKDFDRQMWRVAITGTAFLEFLAGLVFFQLTKIGGLAFIISGLVFMCIGLIYYRRVK